LLYLTMVMLIGQVELFALSNNGHVNRTSIIICST